MSHEFTCMCVCMYVRMYVCRCVRGRYKCTKTNACVYVCMCVCIYVRRRYTCTKTNVCLYVCRCGRLYVLGDIDVRRRTYVCILCTFVRETFQVVCAFAHVRVFVCIYAYALNDEYIHVYHMHHVGMNPVAWIKHSRDTFHGASQCWCVRAQKHNNERASVCVCICV